MINSVHAQACIIATKRHRAGLGFQPRFYLRPAASQHLEAGFLAVLMQLLTVLDLLQLQRKRLVPHARFDAQFS